MMFKVHVRIYLYAELGSRFFCVSVLHSVFILLSTFYFYPLHFNTSICTFYSLYFKTGRVTLVLMQKRM